MTSKLISPQPLVCACLHARLRRRCWRCPARRVRARHEGAAIRPRCNADAGSGVGEQRATDVTRPRCNQRLILSCKRPWPHPRAVRRPQPCDSDPDA
ncbi:hypothetical protein BV20DRAFT_700749 [Pilatotrama ljubarskyi]|nr:hypothetical protein BV20DRAFT_700749 [Pilatotrama ljubarskyi]